MELITHVINLDLYALDELLFDLVLLRENHLIGLPHEQVQLLQLSDASTNFCLTVVTVLVKEALSASEIVRAGLIEANKLYLILKMRMIWTDSVILTL